MNTENVKKIISQMNCRMELEKELLTDLDNEIADGDHGINMARGFSAAEKKLSDKEIIKCGVDAAYSGIEFTKTIAATKGRASYIGERSIGHQDPGATSYTFLLEVIAENI